MEKGKILYIYLMESQIAFDAVCSKEDFALAGQNHQETVQCLKINKKN